MSTAVQKPKTKPKTPKIINCMGELVPLSNDSVNMQLNIVEKYNYIKQNLFLYIIRYNRDRIIN